MLAREAIFLICSAKGIGNRARIMSYVLANAWKRLLKSRGLPREMKIDFKELSFIFKTFTSELTPYFEIYLKKAYEAEPAFIARPGDIVFDVGANIGMYAIRQARRGGRVYAFEPNYDAFSRLKRNISLNNLENVIPVASAVHSKTGIIAFSMNPKSTLAGKVVISPEKSALSSHVDVEAVSLDDFADSIKCPRINILKIDTEGHESEVLKGAKATLAKTEKIVLEYHTPGQKAQITETLTKNGEFGLVLDLNRYRLLYFKRR